MTGTDLADLMVETSTSGVGVLRDTATGGVAILLSADRAAALEVFLDNLPLSHDLVQEGYDPDGVDVIMTIWGTLKGSL